LTASQANGLVNERFNEPLPSYICLLPFYSFVFCFQRLSRHCAATACCITQPPTTTRQPETVLSLQFALKFETFRGVRGVPDFRNESQLFGNVSGRYIANGNLYRDRHTRKAHVLKNASSGRHSPATAAGAVRGTRRRRQQQQLMLCGCS
jgi:hypothetical protein